MKEIFFLSGLPRAGNTLFGSLMNQNPDIAATSNSITPIIIRDLMRLKFMHLFRNFPDYKSVDNIAYNLLDIYYKDWNYKYIIDRAPWGMPENLRYLKEARKNVKIIVLVRDVIEILASFVRWSQRTPDAFINRYRAKTVEEKCDMMMENANGVIINELVAIKHLLHPKNKGLSYMVEYDYLVKHPKKTLEGVYDFLEIPKFEHRYINFDQFKVNGVKYEDEVVGDGLHTIRTDVIRKSEYDAYKIIPKSIVDKYKHHNFWR